MTAASAALCLCSVGMLLGAGLLFAIGLRGGV